MSDPQWFREMAEHWRQMADLGAPDQREPRLRLAAHFDHLAAQAEAGEDDTMP